MDLRNAQSRAILACFGAPRTTKALASQMAYVTSQTRKAKSAGVKTSVSIVAVPRPNTTAVAICFHQSEVGLSIEYPPAKKSMLSPTIIGASPAIVVMVVRRTGRMRCSAVRIIASIFGILVANS